MRRSRWLATVAMVCGASVAVTAIGPADPAYEIDWYTIDGGGGTSSGGVYEISGTIGQPDAGALSGGPYVVEGGFWPGISGVESCAGDTNGDGLVDVDDLLNVILDWDTDGSAHNGDVDDNGTVNVDDLTTVILAWGVCE